MLWRWAFRILVERTVVVQDPEHASEGQLEKGANSREETNACSYSLLSPQVGCVGEALTMILHVHVEMNAQLQNSLSSLYKMRERITQIISILKIIKQKVSQRSWFLPENWTGILLSEDTHIACGHRKGWRIATITFKLLLDFMLLTCGLILTF